jgi:microcystin-dependent protein
MAEPFIAEIRMFGGNFAPRNWAFCDVQLLAIAQNQSLFSLLGTTYGGDGRTSFGLPDLRGRLPIHKGTGPGLTTRSLGEKFGSEQEILSTNEVAPHSHTATGQARCKDGNGTTDLAKGNIWSDDLGSSSATYSSNPADDLMAVDSVAVTLNNAGSNQGHANVQPSLGINYIIALFGTYPSRN